MIGSARPMTCCDRECAIVNGCMIGGVECERCGRYFCEFELDDDGLCEKCAEEAARECEEEEE